MATYDDNAARALRTVYDYLRHDLDDHPSSALSADELFRQQAEQGLIDAIRDYVAVSHEFGRSFQDTRGDKIYTIECIRLVKRSVEYKNIAFEDLQVVAKDNVRMFTETEKGCSSPSSASDVTTSLTLTPTGEPSFAIFSYVHQTQDSSARSAKTRKTRRASRPVTTTTTTTRKTSIKVASRQPLPCLLKNSIALADVFQWANAWLLVKEGSGDKTVSQLREGMAQMASEVCAESDKWTERTPPVSVLPKSDKQIRDRIAYTYLPTTSCTFRIRGIGYTDLVWTLGIANVCDPSDDKTDVCWEVRDPETERVLSVWNYKNGPMYTGKGHVLDITTWSADGDISLAHDLFPHATLTNA